MRDATLCEASVSQNGQEASARASFTRLRSIHFLPIKQCKKNCHSTQCWNQQRKELLEFLKNIEHVPVHALGELHVLHHYYDGPVGNTYRVSAYYLLRNLLYDQGTKIPNGGYNTYEDAKQGGWTDKLLIQLECDIIVYLRGGNKQPTWDETSNSLLTKTKRFISRSKYNLSRETVEKLMPQYVQYFEEETDIDLHDPLKDSLGREHAPMIDNVTLPQNASIDAPYHINSRFQTLGVLIFAGSGWIMFYQNKPSENRPTQPGK